jgi:hypothetical protein
MTRVLTIAVECLDNAITVKKCLEKPSKSLGRTHPKRVFFPWTRVGLQVGYVIEPEFGSWANEKPERRRRNVRIARYDIPVSTVA